MKQFSRRRFTELVALGALAGCTTPPTSKRPADWTLHSPDRYGAPTDSLIPWRLVARSDLIVRGTLKVPSDPELASAQSGNKAISIPFSVTHVFKGQVSEASIQVTYWPDHFADIPLKRLKAARERDSIVFLVRPDEESDTRINHYFSRSDDSALMPASSALDDALAAQTAQQGALTKAVVEFLAVHAPPNDAYVAALIEQLVAERTAYDAAEEILSLGLAYAAALVRHIDDRRPVAIDHVAIPAPAGNFESIIQYGPETVVDVVSLALEQATDDFLGATHNGGSERARRRVVDAWGVWLGRSLRLQTG